MRFFSNSVSIGVQSYNTFFLLILFLNKISKITLLVFDLNFCSFRKQVKEVSVFAGAPLDFRICICSVIQKDQEKLVITH